MTPFFKNPLNTHSTGVVFLKTIIFKEIFFNDKSKFYDNNQSIRFLIKRLFSWKKYDTLIFIPLSWVCFFARKGDVIILPDDSLRSISSVARVRFSTKSYIKGFYQIYRYIITYILFLGLRRCVLYTVSSDDLKTLKNKFPKNKIRYLPHPIQAQYNNDVVCPISENVKNIGFINLQEHYSLAPALFLTKASKLEGYNIIYHGGYSKYWFDYSVKVEFGINLSHKIYVEDFDTFFNSIDVVVMPLVAGAGVKNILLNSIYRNKIVFGTKEAFSGMPISLSQPFIINDSGLLVSKIKNINLLQRDFDKLRKYIIEHHSISEFKAVLNGER